VVHDSHVSICGLCDEWYVPLDHGFHFILYESPHQEQGCCSNEFHWNLLVVCGSYRIAFLVCSCILKHILLNQCNGKNSWYAVSEVSKPVIKIFTVNCVGDWR
jgi:hypothetical protein